MFRSLQKRKNVFLGGCIVQYKYSAVGGAVWVEISVGL